MKNILLSASFIALSSAAFAESSISANYETVDVNATSSGVSISGDGDGFTVNGTLDVSDDFVATASFSSASGTIAGVAWSVDGTAVGVGYKLIDELDEDSGLQLLAGIGYLSSSGDVTSGGTKYDISADSTVLLGQARARAGESLSIAGEVLIDIEGDSDPTFSVGLGYDLTETGSINLGYSANNTTSSDGITTEITGWSLGYRLSF